MRSLEGEGENARTNPSVRNSSTVAPPPVTKVQVKKGFSGESKNGFCPDERDNRVIIGYSIKVEVPAFLPRGVW